MTQTAETPDGEAGDGVPESIEVLHRRQLDTLNQIAKIVLHGARAITAPQSEAASQMLCAMAPSNLEGGMASVLLSLKGRLASAFRIASH